MRYTFIHKKIINLESKSPENPLKKGYKVGFNSNQKVERSGEYGSSVRTNRPSPRPSKES